MTEQKVMRGLSYSSFSEYSACPRKWFYRKVMGYPIDTDSSEDTEAFTIGKAFHKCLEDFKHNLKGFTLQNCTDVCASFGIEDTDTVCLIFAMLGKYKKVHELTNLSVVACELEVSTPLFFGVVDVVMYEPDVGFWIVDIKTAGSWMENTITTAAAHTQLSIYSKYSKEIAFAVGMPDVPFAGCRLRVTTKARLKRKADESDSSYIVRLTGSTRSGDIIIPASIIMTDVVSSAHEAAAKKIMGAKPEDIEKFPQNFSNCFSYFKPCSHHSKCFKCNYTEMPKVTVLE